MLDDGDPSFIPFTMDHRSYLVNLSKIHEIVPWFDQNETRGRFETTEKVHFFIAYELEKC